MSPYLFTLILDVLTKNIQDLMPLCMLFADDIVIVEELKDEINKRLELRRQALKAHSFVVSRRKMEYIECKFGKGHKNSNLEMKIGDAIILEVTRFKYHGPLFKMMEK